TRSSNNYGPWQYPEKIVPLFITNAIDEQALPVYGDGLNVRDWLHVEDNCAAIDAVLRRGLVGEVYNIGGGNEVTNLDLTQGILERLGKHTDLIRYVADRPGHDRRYAVDCTKVKSLGWEPRIAFKDGLQCTVDWYRDNPDWWRTIKSGEWREYYARQYAALD
ncbi:MAG TPA: GDP-mannose 4,6-dehydratase, partial [Thermoleophilia bacterium]|nr:GDP-mannose 4,6-dehydratase [Thermoleophilia bacterium]